MPTALQLAEGHPALQDAVRRSRTLLHRRALVSAGVGVVPVPGLDWAVNAALLSRLIPKINREFGLDASQLDQLTPHKREQVQKAVNIVGTVLVGKVLTRDFLLDRIWGYEFYGETRTVDVHIRHIRQKLGDDAHYIETIRGVGYKFNDRQENRL